METQIRIKGMVLTSQYGTLSDGTLLRCSQEYARHLVEDCKAAEYVNASPKADEATPEEKTPAKEKTRKPKTAGASAASE